MSGLISGEDMYYIMVEIKGRREYLLQLKMDSEDDTNPTMKWTQNKEITQGYQYVKNNNKETILLYAKIIQKDNAELNNNKVFIRYHSEEI